MPTNLEGAIVAGRGTNAERGRAFADDPRWVRLLPWVGRLKGALGPWGFLAALGLAVVNVAVPFLIVRVARGRHRYLSLRALMALPVAAAVPLMVLVTVVPRLPLSVSPLLSSTIRLFVSGTVAGVPMLLCIGWMGASMVRGRLRLILALGALSLVTTLMVAGGWLWVAGRSMAAIEHYWWEGWELVLLPGAYAAAVLWVFGRVVIGAFRIILRARTG